MEQRYGLGLSIDQGFADQARQERMAATQTADQLQASNPGFGLQSVLPSLKGAFASAGAVGSQQAKATLDLSQMQRQLETSEFVSKLAKEAVDNQFITQEEAASFDALGRTDAAKALEALSKTANGRRVDLAATNFVNQAAVPRIEQTMAQIQAEMQKAEAARAEAMKRAEADPLRFDPTDLDAMEGGQVDVAGKLEELRRTLYAEIDSSMSQMLPEARDAAKKKVDDYIYSKTPKGASKNNDYAKLMAKMALAKQSQEDEKALRVFRSDIIREVKNTRDILKDQLKSSIVFSGTMGSVGDVAEKDMKAYSIGTHPNTLFAVMSGTGSASVDGKPVGTAAMNVARQVLDGINQYAKAMSGAQVTVAEAGRIFAALGLEYPPTLGMDSSDISVWKEVMNDLTTAMSAAMKQGRISHDQVVNALNEMAKSRERAIVNSGLIGKDSLLGDNFRQYELYRSKVPQGIRERYSSFGDILSTYGIPVRTTLPAPEKYDVKVDLWSTGRPNAPTSQPSSAPRTTSGGGAASGF